MLFSCCNSFRKAGSARRLGSSRLSSLMEAYAPPSRCSVLYNFVTLYMQSAKVKMPYCFGPSACVACSRSTPPMHTTHSSPTVAQPAAQIPPLPPPALAHSSCTNYSTILVLGRGFPPPNIHTQPTARHSTAQPVAHAVLALRRLAVRAKTSAWVSPESFTML